MALSKREGQSMDHLSNWIEFPVTDMKRARKFYAELLGVVLNEMPMGSNEYAFFELNVS
jgi:predicted enzyme related to lactoylglutathione lyase